MKLYESLKISNIEREVEDAYNEELKKYFKSPITHPYACDGLISDKDSRLNLIVEYKFDEDMTNKIERSKVLIQVIFYLKQFELHGETIPNVALIADKNECFVLHTNCLLKYLDEEGIDWNTAPSCAKNKYVDFVLKIASDEDRNPFVFDVCEEFDFKAVVDKIIDCSKNIIRHVKISEHNIQKVYGVFENRVLSKKNKMNSKDSVSLFINILLDRDNYYLHPNKKNCLVTPNGNTQVKGEAFNAFFCHFEKEYSPVEKMKMTEIADRLIEDEDRRKSGDFWTPSVFVDYSHKRIEKVLGSDWKEKYVVWDCACGTKNLTRDYNFKELYCSTLFRSELDMAVRYNTNSVSFQFDFLNDDLEKIPEGLMNALKENKPIVFYINPPYGTASNMDDTHTKGSICKTKINELMIENDMGKSSANLYSQFLYRIMIMKEKFNLTNCHIAFFCKPNYMTGYGYKKFRAMFLKYFSFNDGFLFNAGHFSDCSSKWGINFSIWKDKNTIDNQ